MAMEKFHYTSRAGDEITLPWKGQIPYGVMEDLDEIPDDKKTFALVRMVTKDDPDTYAKIRRLETEEAEVFFDAWTKGSDITVGESGAS